MAGGQTTLDIQTPVVFALSLYGLVVSSGMNLSLVSRMRELSIVGFPSSPTERRERGTVLC